MVAAALELFGRRGYHATAFSDVVEAGNVPRGSIYFHFPGYLEGGVNESTHKAWGIHQACSRRG